MDSTQRIKPRDLVVGGRYLQRNGLSIREITEISGNAVGYLDEEGKDRWCSNSVLVRACPTVAAPEDEARVAEESRRLSRLTDRGEFTIRDEANALTARAFRNGFLEELHAGKPSEFLAQPGLSRISDEEMQKLMIQASAKLEELLRLKSEKPAKYEEWVRDYNRRYCRSWERDREEVGGGHTRSLSTGNRAYAAGSYAARRHKSRCAVGVWGIARLGH